MAELRDSIKANWATTGLELSKDFKQFWQSSRPASPARTPIQDRQEGATAVSPSPISRLSHLDIPRVGGERNSSDFAAGYSLGLIGGVRSWVSNPNSSCISLEDVLMEMQMARSQRNLNDSRPESPSSEESSDDRSVKDPPRGRTGKQTKTDEMDVGA